MRRAVAVLLLQAGATTTLKQHHFSPPPMTSPGGVDGVGADEKQQGQQQGQQQGCTAGLTVTGSPNAALFDADYYADTFSLCGFSSCGAKSSHPDTEMRLGSSWLGSSCTIANGSSRRSWAASCGRSTITPTRPT
jgi:hypothetical protein